MLDDILGSFQMMKRKRRRMTRMRRAMRMTTRMMMVMTTMRTLRTGTKWTSRSQTAATAIVEAPPAVRVTYSLVLVHVLQCNCNVDPVH